MGAYALKCERSLGISRASSHLPVVVSFFVNGVLKKKNVPQKAFFPEFIEKISTVLGSLRSLAI